MPLTESDEEILFHQPANVNETPDRADAQRKNAPPSKRVVRPSAEANLSDVIRHQPPPERAAAREVPKTQQPAPAQVPAASPSTKPSAHEEFAAAAARARAAVNQQLLDSEAKKAAQAPAKGIPEARRASQAQAQSGQRPAAAPAQQIPAPASPAKPAQAAPAQAAAGAQAAHAQPQAQPARPKQATQQAEAAQLRRAAQAPQKTPAASEPAPSRSTRPQKADPGPPARVAQQAAAQAPVTSPAPETAGSTARISEQGQARATPPRAQVLTEPEPQVAAQAQGRSEAAPQTRRDTGKSFLLHTHGLKKVYDGRAVVNGVEVTVRPSEIVGLLGPNGAGKTTTFYMIVGLIQPNGGSVTFDGKDATNQPMYRRARLGMGYLPQEESIFRKLSVEDNILAVMETQDVPRSERRDRCHELMKRFGIERLAKNEAITLSGGEKRRLTIARSLVTNPKLLMLDEPFSGVDPIAVGEIQEIVRSLREQGLAILITDHNVRETLDIVDRAYLLFEGRVEREGTRDFLINDPLSRQLYLGERFSM